VKPLRIEDEAEEELEGAVDYYEGKRSGLGLALEQRIREAFQKNPAQCEPVSVLQENALPEMPRRTVPVSGLLSGVA
jgi:hypothetical protein